MIIISALLNLILLAHSQADPVSFYDLEEAKSRCTTHFSESPELYMNEFSWGYSLDSMAVKFEEIYESGKRIGTHSNFDPETDQFYLYLDKYHNFAPFKITPEFIKSVTLQIETAHVHRYGEFVFFPDMGHSHLHFPLEHWQENYADKEFTKQERYEKMLADPELRPLYHLTEQLQMTDENDEVLDDPVLAFKYWHRNFMGYNNTTTGFDVPVDNSERYNTVRDVPGYHRWSAGFAVSASKDGCFPYRDQNGVKRYFDISLSDPQYDPTQGIGPMF